MEGESYFRRLARNVEEEGWANEEKRAIIAVETGTGTTGEVCGVTLSSSSTSSFSLSFHPAPVYCRLAAESRPATAAAFSQRPTQCTVTTTTTTKASVVQRPAPCDFTLVLPSLSELYTHPSNTHAYTHPLVPAFVVLALSVV